MGSTSRIGIYGWGVVAPGAPDVRRFRQVVESGRTTLGRRDTGTPGDGLFAVGDPTFDFDSYRDWITARVGEFRFNQIRAKTGENTLFALGALAQALEASPKLEEALKGFDEACHIYVGSGLGDLPQAYLAHDQHRAAWLEWERYWAAPERCAARRAFEASGATPPSGRTPPPPPADFPVDSPERADALAAWHAFWAAESAERADFERAYVEAERIEVGTNLQTGPLTAIRAREKARRRLLESYGCPAPPWCRVGSELVFSVQNVPAAQMSMLLGTHGPAWAPVGACSTFGLGLKVAVAALRAGEAKAVIVGTTDPRPDPAVVSSFHGARLVPGTGDVNSPLTSLRGTHIAGGACVWVVANEDDMRPLGLEPIGGYVAGVGLSSDADHIITPSATGPKRAIRAALRGAGIGKEDLAVWDMHATGTPGDAGELQLIAEFMGDGTRITARKGIFGHGMSNAGGWELTALAMGLAEGVIWPSGVPVEQVHPALAGFAPRLVTATAPAHRPYAAKLMLGIGGITACVVIRGARDAR